MRRLCFAIIGSAAASLFSVSGASAQAIDPNGPADGANLQGFELPGGLGALGGLEEAPGPLGLGDGVVDSDLDPTLLAQVQAAAQSGDEAAIATLAENNPTLAASIAREAAKANPSKAADFAKAVVEKVPTARADVQREVVAAVPSAKDAIETKIAEVPTTPTTGGGEQQQAGGEEEEEVVTGSVPNNNDGNNDPIVIANNNVVENALQDTGDGSPQLP